MSKALPPPKIVNNSIQRLTRMQSYFRSFTSIEDWVVNENPTTLDREEAYFIQLKNFLINRYRLQDIYLSPSAMDDVVFFTLQNSNPRDFLSDVEKLIKKSQLHRNSIVIFPIHYFGFSYGGLGYLTNRGNIGLTHGNFRVNSQTNSFQTTISNIRQYLEDVNFPTSAKIDYSTFEHYYRSRHLKWFDNNPLLFLNFRFSQYDRFDNVRFIMEKINFTTNKLYFLYALRSERDRVGSLFSTKTTNNWETLDIKHFLTVTSNNRIGVINCIPIHYKYSMIYENMHMNIDLKPRKKSLHLWEQEAINSIDALYEGYLRFLVTKNKIYAIYYRIANSLGYFRRSVKAVNKEDKAININIAFETLLLDMHEPNKRQKMLSRIWQALKGKINKRDNLKNLEEAISERNDVVHAGLPASGSPDYEDVYRTYCRLILFLRDNIKSIDSTRPEYLSDFYDNL